MKGFPIAHIFHPSIPPMYAVVNNHGDAANLLI